MSTFLELAQELRSLTGINGTGPTNVATATGIELKLVNYVKNAYTDIQAHPKDWKWMWGDYLAPAPGGAPLLTIDNVSDYALTSVKKVLVETFRSYLTATGVSDRQRMHYIDYEEFQNRYGVVSSTNNRPIHVTRLPTGDLRFYPTPNAVYSIEFEYIKDPTVLAVNADTPAMPSEYHQLIVYEALKRYGRAEDAPELIDFAEKEAGSEGGEGVPASGLWRALMWSQELRRAARTNENEFMTVVPE